MHSLKSIFGTFLKIGFIAFGGPAAHAALMERELVSRRKWLDAQAFLDYVGAVNLIPGPNSTQLTMLVGYQLRGFRGMLAAGFGFIIPAALITGLLAWLYMSSGQLPALSALFFGIKPAVIAVIAAAILQLGKKAMKSAWLGILGLITLLASLLFLNEITAILGAGLLGVLAYTADKCFRGRGPNGNSSESVIAPADKQNNHMQTPKHNTDKNILFTCLSSLKRHFSFNSKFSALNAHRSVINPHISALNALRSVLNPNISALNAQRSVLSFSPAWLLTAIPAGLASFSLLKLFWVFLKIGALLFGTGYVLIAYIDGELVEKLGWLTRDQLLDAIAIGQFTPGPILSAATFVGYVLSGVPGAIVATLGIFLPSFAYIMVLYPIIPKMRKSPYAAAFLDSVNVAAVAVMLSVSIVMILQILNVHVTAGFSWQELLSDFDWRAGLIMALAMVVVFRFKKLGAVWVILGGAALGLALTF